MATDTAFQPSDDARKWMKGTQVSKKEEMAAIDYLKNNNAPTDTVEQFHHIRGITESFDTRLSWLKHDLEQGRRDTWGDFAVNKIIGARLIFVMEEHKKSVRANSSFTWQGLIDSAKKKFPQ